MVLKIFEELLERVGGKGRYQVIVISVSCLIYLMVGSVNFYLPFLFHQEPYQCLPEIADCHQYVCSLPQSLRSAYIPAQPQPMLQSFGDFRCQGQDYLDWLQLLIYVSGALGSAIGIIIQKYLSQRSILIICLVVHMIGTVLSLLTKSLGLASVGFGLNMAAKSITSAIAVTMAVGATDQQWHSRLMMLMSIIYGIGVTLNGFVFWIIKNWKVTLIVYHLLPYLVTIIFLFTIVQQVPFEAVTLFPADKAYETYTAIGRKNGKEDHGIAVEELQRIRQQYDYHQSLQHNYDISILNFCKYDSLRGVFLLCCLLYFFYGLQFNAPYLFLRDYGNSIYLNGTLLGFSQIIGCVIGLVLIQGIRRKVSIVVCQLLGLTVSLILFVILQGHSQGETAKTWESTGLFVLRVICTLAYYHSTVWQVELFPQQVKALAFQAMLLSLYISTALIPHIQTFLQSTHFSPVVFFALICLVIGIGSMFLPETLGQPQLEVIEQLQYDHVSHQHQLNSQPVP